MQKNARNTQAACPSCGTTYEEFVKNSCFGCADCYGVFDILMHDNIKKLQGSDVHTGKHPHSGAGPSGEELTEQEKQIEAFGERTPEEKIRALDRKLKEALRREDYEMAAQCRDQIRALREGKDTDEKMV